MKPHNKTLPAALFPAILFNSTHQLDKCNPPDFSSLPRGPGQPLKFGYENFHFVPKAFA